MPTIRSHECMQCHNLCTTHNTLFNTMPIDVDPDAVIDACFEIFNCADCKGMWQVYEYIHCTYLCACGCIYIVLSVLTNILFMLVYMPVYYHW